MIKNLILDMDGVLWRGETPIVDLGRFFGALRALDITFVLATNNATKVATQYQAKLARLGADVPAGQILTSSEATASYLTGVFPAGATIYPVGEEGLRLALREQGFRLLDHNGYARPGSRADAVVVGFNREVCYPQLASASALILKGAKFIGTNPDVSFPSEYGPLPGAGSLIAFIEAATGVKAEIVGKPGRVMFQEALRRLASDPAETAMVGDRLGTDILGGHNAGLQTILVLSGITQPHELETSSLQPTYIFDDINALVDHLKHSGD